MTDLIETVDSAFTHLLGRQPELFVQAPGRVNLIGEHTDYNDGFVLPAAINYQTIIAASPRDDSIIRVVATDYDNEMDQFDLKENIAFQPEKIWSNYIRGVASGLMSGGHRLSGADLVVSGNIPQGAGLSSSASVEVAVGQTFRQLCGLDIDEQQIALMGQQAENDFVGCNCGIMDQLISAKGREGHALLIDCRSLATEAVPMPEGVVILIVDSNRQRGLVDSEYNLRREQCEQAARLLGVRALRDASPDDLEAQLNRMEAVVARRARHVITENSRTLLAADALERSDLRTMGELMAASHVSMREDFEITVREIDVLVDIIGEALGDVGGVRMTGGGFGGCVVALMTEDRLPVVQAAIDQHYEALTGLKANSHRCTPSAGAGIVSI